MKKQTDELIGGVVFWLLFLLMMFFAFQGGMFPLFNKIGLELNPLIWITGQ